MLRATNRGRAVVADTVVVEIDAGDGVDGEAGVQVGHGGELEVTEPVQRPLVELGGVDALEGKVVADVAVGVTVVAMEVGGIACVAALSDVVVERVGVLVVGGELEAARELALERDEASVEVGAGAGVDDVDGAVVGLGRLLVPS